MSHRDPLDLLRQAFAALPAPPPERPLREEDAATRAAVAWAARAFAALPVPAAPGLPRAAPRAASARAPLPARGQPWWRPLAAAALLIALLSLPLVFDGARPRGARRPLPTPAPAPSGAPLADAAGAPRVTVTADGRSLQLRSGPVVLLLPTDPSPRFPQGDS